MKYFDQHYLGHKFARKPSYNEYDYTFICSKCKIKIWNGSINSNRVPNYWVLNEMYQIIALELKLSCEEIIIKNIIE